MKLEISAVLGFLYDFRLTTMMIIFSPEIDGNEYFQKAEVEIVKVCGLDVNEYYTNKNILTKKLWDKNLDRIVLAALDVDVLVGFQTVGHLAMQTGGNLPTPIHSQILKYCEWEQDKTLGWKGKTIERRKQILKEFREKQSAHYELYMQKFK